MYYCLTLTGIQFIDCKQSTNYYFSKVLNKNYYKSEDYLRNRNINYFPDFVYLTVAATLSGTIARGPKAA